MKSFSLAVILTSVYFGICLFFDSQSAFFLGILMFVSLAFITFVSHNHDIKKGILTLGKKKLITLLVLVLVPGVISGQPLLALAIQAPALYSFLLACFCGFSRVIQKIVDRQQ